MKGHQTFHFNNNQVLQELKTSFLLQDCERLTSSGAKQVEDDLKRARWNAAIKEHLYQYIAVILLMESEKWFELNKYFQNCRSHTTEENSSTNNTENSNSYESLKLEIFKGLGRKLISSQDFLIKFIFEL